ncbi:uncharacterized protein LOC131657741 [Vicia villosa]|uniref:uncharacterized protein LOC131657741 n=1 Tax=Vicia villosa TaxID=3911 RepID=UPI00273C96E4|nr:uncharacterized protein LOC131657741 [Vicia villosa]
MAKKTKKNPSESNVQEEAQVKSQESDHFNVTFHHGGEFVRVGGEEIIYRGGVDTTITGMHVGSWGLDSIVKIVSRLGYEEGSFRVWTKVLEIQEGFLYIRSDDDAVDFAMYFSVMNVTGDLYVEHSKGVKFERSDRAPNCVNEEKQLDGLEEEIVDGLDDSEDERATGLADGFDEEIDDTLPLNVDDSHLGPLGEPNKGLDDEDQYQSDELNSDDPDDSCDEDKPKYDKYKKEHLNKDFKFKWGMEFNSLNDFRGAIREWSVLNGREISFVKNEAHRVRVICKSKCGFLVLCSKVGHQKTFAIKTLVDKHTCARVLNNKSASSRWVAKHVVKRMQTCESIRIRDIMQDIRQNFSVGITVARAWRAKLIAKRIIEGDADNQYASIFRYAAELIRVNPRNTAKVNVVRPCPTIQPRFGSFYFCFDGCKKGFTNGCRPFVGVDGCHLKTKYGGQLLIAVGRDANDQYFPLAFGLVENETKESWKWFIQLLLEDIGQERRYVFISDQQKGLVAVFDELSNRIEHRLCLRHLYANFKKRFGGGALIRDLMMGAAKATYYQAWVTKMNELKCVDPNAWSWLSAVPPKSWCKHAFTFYPKCDVLMNNIAESFNATILVARDKPILTMCEWIRKYLMNRVATSVSKLEKWPHNVMPIPRKRLDNEVFHSGNWLPTWSMAETFQVTHTYNNHEFIVDISKRSCSCNFWELVGIPCRHAVAALSYRSQNPCEFVDECYSRNKYAECYGYAVSPINGQDMWPEVDIEPPLPPVYKTAPGRPRKIRIRESGEEGARKRRQGVAYKCTKCDKFGHNSLTCKAKTHDPNALKRKRKAKVTSANAVESSAVESSAVESNIPPTNAEESNIPPANAVQPPANADESRVPPANAVQPPVNAVQPPANAVQPPDNAVESNIPTEMSQSGSSVVDSHPVQRSNKRRQSERIKLFWFKKPITGRGSENQPIVLPE